MQASPTLEPDFSRHKLRSHESKSILENGKSLLLLKLIQLFLISTGVLFKEQAITFLGVFILLDVLTLFVINFKNPTFKSFQTFLFLDIFISFTFLLSILYFRLWIMNFQSPVFAEQDNPFALIESLAFRYLNFIYVYLLNAFILLCPIWLCFDWSMGCISPIENLNDLRIFIVISFISFAIFALFSIRKRPGLLFVSLAFIVLPFLPSSNLFFRVGFVIAERNLFLSVLGFAVLVSMGCFELYEMFSSRKYCINTGLVFLLFMFCLKTNLVSFIFPPFYFFCLFLF